MAKTIEENAGNVLSTLANQPREPEEYMDGPKLQKLTGLTPLEISDAVTILENSGYVDCMRSFGTAPFDFRGVMITPRGRYEYERMTRNQTVSQNPKADIMRPPVPVGSPYGFKDEDWEEVAETKARANQLRVVFGFQFNSNNYVVENLRQNVCNMFKKAIETYNKLPGAMSIELNFKPLEAGYGEHLFNEIARNIISADIAVFDTSDLNSNVMLEMGVALTWGIRVLPIKKEGCPKPPSDISGQTWADYKNDGSEFVDTDHESKLLRMVELAARKKRRA